jgi:hypothetical protein
LSFADVSAHRATCGGLLCSEITFSGRQLGVSLARDGLAIHAGERSELVRTRGTRPKCPTPIFTIVFPSFEYRDFKQQRRCFYVQAEHNREDGAPTVGIAIWPSPEIMLGTSSYSARFKYIDSDTLQSVWIGNNELLWAMRVSLSEAVFSYVKRRYSVNIVSSRGCVARKGEWQTALADDMWKRLVIEGLARWDRSKGDTSSSTRSKSPSLATELTNEILS